MRLYATLFVLFHLTTVNQAQDGPTVFAVAPNVLRTDTDATVSVVLFNIYNQVTVSVFLQDYPGRIKTFATSQVTLKDSIPTNVSVKVTSSDLPDVDPIEQGSARYVYLVVQSKDRIFKFSHETEILVQPFSGHVFIQTDKPLYNPMQQVKIRVIPVGQDLLPLSMPVRLDILNPQGVIVQRKDNMKWNDTFISNTYSLIQNPIIGNWTVRASYGNDFLSEERVTFEVKDYSLPIFKVNIVACPYILPDTDKAKGHVTARYLYGKPVKGSVSFTFGVSLDGEITTFKYIRKQLNEKGLSTFTITTSDMRQRLDEDKWFPDGGRLYIRAEVTVTASGHREVEENLSCNFVRSPYVFTFTRSAEYFQPTLPYHMKIDAKFTNGNPAKKLKVNVETIGWQGNDKMTLQNVAEGKLGEIQLNSMGQGTMTVDMIRNVEYVTVTVTSLDKLLKDHQQSVGVFTIRPYITPSNSYIKVQTYQDLVEVGGQLRVQALATGSTSITRINFLVMSRGNVVHMQTIRREAGLTTTTHFTVTPAMVPSVRVLAYYISGRDVIADSLWVDVVDKCEHEVTIEADQQMYQPEKGGHLTLRGDNGTLVELLAVDEAVYLLNTQDMLTRKHMFNVLETFDLGCGPGGGRNSSSVFQDSGLSVVTSVDLETKKRRRPECDKTSKNRCKREAGNFGTISGRSASGSDFSSLIVENEDDIRSRTHFPESWLFGSTLIREDGVGIRHVTFPSSITRWVVQAISVSPKSGLCVASPLNITVFKNFFVEVNLPTRVVRKEQLEVKVTIYNYSPDDIVVVLYMVGVKGICSETPAGKESGARRFTIPGADAKSTTYPIIPLELGSFKIRIFAFSTSGGDKVEKILHVVPEGQRVEKSFYLLLDPGKEMKQREADQIQYDVVEVSVPEIAIKGTANCHVSATGSVLGPTVRTVVDGVKDMLDLPTGSGEQTMMMMAPTVYAMEYLQSTKQILKDARIETIGHDYIKQGYVHELTYRKGDGSFSIYPDRPSSVWLTAFVMKVFCQARDYAEIDKTVICSGLHWLTLHQADDGRYVKKYSFEDQRMIGGVNDDVSLTAFVLIAIHECSYSTEHKCSTELSQRVSEGKGKALGYLERQLDNIKRPFAFAIISYALALANSLRTLEVNEALCAMSVYDEDKNTRYWPVGTNEHFGKLPYWFKKKPTRLSVETTAYALLALLALGKIQDSNPVVKWLTLQRNSKGAFISTQDTVVALQALSQYATKTYSEKLDLISRLTSNDDPRFTKELHLKHENALVQKVIYKVPTGSQLFIETKGTGVGQMQVVLSYNIPREADRICRFQLKVESVEIPFRPIHDRNCDVCGQHCIVVDEIFDYDIDHGELIDQTDVDKKRSRVGREARERSRKLPSIGGYQRDEPSEKSANVIRDGIKAICINVCTRSLTGKATGMSVIDVGLSTGFTPINDDLRKITNAGTADKYEASDRSVIFYLDSIPDDDLLCVKFRAKQDHNVGNIQPVAVHVYDYYNPEDTCTKFYSSQSKSGLLQHRCEGNVCKCLAGTCNKCYTKKERRALKIADLRRKACDESDYVHRVKIDKLEDHNEKPGNSGSTMVKVDATLRNVIKNGRRKFFDEDRIVFWKLKSCTYPEFTSGKEYLIMGMDGQRYLDEYGFERFKFDIDHEAFVMEFFNKNNIYINLKDRILGHLMDKLSEELKEKGCPT